jgi:hypothetical protein
MPLSPSLNPIAVSGSFDTIPLNVLAGSITDPSLTTFAFIPSSIPISRLLADSFIPFLPASNRILRLCRATNEGDAA